MLTVFLFSGKCVNRKILFFRDYIFSCIALIQKYVFEEFIVSFYVCGILHEALLQ